MLPSPNRLRDPDLFRAASRRGGRAGGSLVVLHLLRAPDQPDRPAAPAQVGLVVSKAVGNAVTRNHVKRRLRHLLRERVEHLPAGSVLVVRARPEAASASYADLGAALDRGLDRLGVRR